MLIQKKRYFENLILKKIKKYKISLICLAGYMRIVSKSFIFNFKNKIINVHPSLLPKFKGLNTYKRVLKNKEIKTGCTVHYVNEKLDSGNKIIQRGFFLNNQDNIEILKEKTQKLEYKLFQRQLLRFIDIINF